jgi:uncharacterized protein
MLEQKVSLSKSEELKRVIENYGSVLVAFSGGTDSTLVLKIARETLGKDKVVAVTAESESIPKRELEEAKVLARELDVRHEIIHTSELDNPLYRENPERRCYFCKSELFNRLTALAKELNLMNVCDGTNTDDLNDFRPGFEAICEREVKSPLVEARLTKQDVRDLSCSLGLSTWNKPANPCLSSRVPYGEPITEEKLRQIETGENFLRDLGFSIVRLRHFGAKARVELGREEFARLKDASLRERVSTFISSLGFKTVLFELYRQGRLNEEKNSHPVSRSE